MTKVMFAVIKSGGRQYKVSVGQTLEVNRLPVEVGEQVHFNEVLLISDANNTMIGTPLVENATVLATATKQGRGKKLIVFRYKPKKRVRHRRGHRQELTILTIDDIIAGGKSLITGAAPKSREEEEEMPPVIAEAETPAESAEVEAATGEVSETAEPEVEEKKPPRRRRTRKTEESESEAGE